MIWRIIGLAIGITLVLLIDEPGILDAVISASEVRSKHG